MTRTSEDRFRAIVGNAVPVTLWFAAFGVATIVTGQWRWLAFMVGYLVLLAALCGLYVVVEWLSGAAYRAWTRRRGE